MKMRKGSKKIQTKVMQLIQDQPYTSNDLKKEVADSYEIQAVHHL
jgi:hypothetical protein